MLDYFKRKIVVTCVLKSGYSFKCHCEAVEWKHFNNDISSITVRNDDGRWPRYIRLDDISVVTWEGR